MRTFLIIVIGLMSFGCKQNQASIQLDSRDYYTNNEDSFGFLVFDRSLVDSFFKNYSPIKYKNDKLKNAVTKLLNLDTPILLTGKNTFVKHSEEPEFSDYELATDVLEAINEKDGEKYFEACVNYLFFFDCLPNEFRYKWVQTQSGDFEFNATFFNYLRTQCALFDKIIYGQIGTWDKHVDSVFKHRIFNEITAENAVAIKGTILSDPIFNDLRFKADKENFISFLDKTAKKEWRLFLFDKN